MASTHEQAIEVLNSAKLATDGKSKVDHLRGLLELVVRKEPGLLPEFMPEVLELQVDPSPVVKRFLVDFIDAAAAASPSPPVLQPSLVCLRTLAADGAAGTAKRALQSCYAIFKTAYTVVATQGSSSSSSADAAELLRAVWSEALALRAAAAATALAPSNEAVRMAAAKFLEQAVLLLTAELVPAVQGVSAAATPLPAGNVVVSKVALVREAEAALGQLVALLKQRHGEAASGPLAVSIIKSVANIAQQRPQFMGRLLPPLLALGNSAAAAPGALPGTSASVRTALETSLRALARSSHPSAQPWKKKLGVALKALGADDIEGQADSHGMRPPANNDPPSKRARLDSEQEQPKWPQQQQPKWPQQQPHRQQVQQLGLGAAAPVLPHMVPTVPVTPPDQLAKVLTVLQALVADQNPTTLARVVDSLQPAVLADVVMAFMAHLPPRHLLPPDSLALPPWIDTLLCLASEQTGTPASLNVAAAAGERRPSVQPQQLAGEEALQVQHVSPEPPGVFQQKQAAAAPPPKQEAAGEQSKIAPVRAHAVASFQLEPLPLTEWQQRHLRVEAVLRILRTHKTGRPQLRTSLVAKLAVQSDGEGVPMVICELLRGLESRSSSMAGDVGEVVLGSDLEVALQLLDVLFAHECQPGAQSQGEVRKSAGSGAPQQLRSSPVDGAVASLPSSDEHSVSGHNPPTSMSTGSLYERTLLQLLHGVRQALPPSSRVLVRLLLEAPAMPMPAVRHFLESMIEAGPDWCTLGLLAARDLILERPPSRAEMLQFVLDACCSPTSDTRSKAVRLVANRLFTHTSMAPQIELAARLRLDAMLPSAPVSAPRGCSADAVPAALHPEDSKVGVNRFDSGEQQHQPAEPQCQQQVQQQQQSQQDAKQGAGQQSAGPVERHAGPGDMEAAQLCALYCALCTKKHSLLRHLFEVYGTTSAGARAAIQRNAGGLAKTLGPVAPALLAVVQDPPAGSLPLVLQMLHVLTDTIVPPALLVTACLQLYDSCKDSRVLVPALRGLDRATALRLLPALLDLQPEQLRPALQRLVVPLPTADDSDAPASPIISPEELLSALHTIEHSREAGLLRKIMQGVTVCISSPALFPPEALAASINQLLTRVPLPQLFMRTVIQTVSAAPKLRSFVVGILRQLGSKQIWQDKTQWKGWLMCIEQTLPDSLPALISLPAEVLSNAPLAPGTKRQLLEFAKQDSVNVPSATLSAIERMATS